MKKFLMVFMAATMFFAMMAITADAVTMYSLDGRSIEVSVWDVDAYKNVGWYDNIYDVRATLYSADGRSVSVWKAEVGEYLNLGWYETIDEVRVTLYAPDGRSMQVWLSEYDSYVSVGWYPAVTLFALDGRWIDVPGYEVENYKAVGWYTLEDYAFIIAQDEYNSYKASGDYISALKEISNYQDLFWETQYEDDIMQMKHTAMDILRNQTKQPLIVEGYSANNGEIEIAFRNVSYKDIIAFKCEFETSDVFGSVIDYFGEYSYYLEDTYIPSGEADIYTWKNQNSSIRWVKNIKMLTVVFADGTIWQR